MTRKKFLEETDCDYSDWFGKGNIKSDLFKVEDNEEEQAMHIYRGEAEAKYMLLVVFKTRYRVIGYDGEEYQHSFAFVK